MARTRTFKSGNSQAIRIPRDMAYSDVGVELEITRTGEVITIFPAKRSMKDVVAALRRLPKIPVEKRVPIRMPTRKGN